MGNQCLKCVYIKLSGAAKRVFLGEYENFFPFSNPLKFGEAAASPVPCTVDFVNQN